MMVFVEHYNVINLKPFQIFDNFAKFRKKKSCNNKVDSYFPTPKEGPLALFRVLLLCVDSGRIARCVFF